jgi:hypothetical protein
MNYINLLVSGLAITFCSCSEIFNDSSKLSLESKTIQIREMAGFDGLPVDMLRYLNNFLENQDQFYLKNVNRFTRQALNMKEQVEQTFNISGLESVDDNEPELAGVMRLAWIRHDPFLFFAALMEEVAGEKKRYKVILRPLIKHLFYTFRSFNPQEQEHYLNYTKIERKDDAICRSVQNRNSLAPICVKYGHFDLLFELFRDEYFEMVSPFLASSENRDEFFEFFRNNSEYVDEFLNAVIIHKNKCYSDSVIVWIAGCIIKNLPPSYYEYENKLRNVKWVLSERMIDILILSTNVSESEYSRIHAQVVKLIEIYSGEMVNNPDYAAFFRIINDIRFGSFDLIDFPAVDFDLIIRNDHRFHKIAKAALLANKMDLFFFICVKFEPYVWQSKSIQILCFENLNVYDFQAKNFKIIIEMIQADSDLFKDEFLIFSFAMEFYSIKHLKLEGDLVIFDFVVSENLLEFGFPPELRIQKLKYRIDQYIDLIFLNMKIFNETTINAFIPDWIDYFNVRSNTGIIVVEVTYKFIEFISELPNLLIFMLENGMRLEIDSNIETLENYFNLGNFEWTSQIIQWTDLHQWKLTKLKTQDHLEKMEKIQKATVAESFLQWEYLFNRNRGNPMFPSIFEEEDAKVKYLEWRSVFAYWIKGSDKEKIKEIQTPEFIKMLKLDFPNETRELFESEQY